MKVIAKNVITGEITERDYTQEEQDAVALMIADSASIKKIVDIQIKREAAVEEILMAGTSVNAIAYQNAKK